MLLQGGALLYAESSVSPLFDWRLLYAGSWEENKTLHNRGDLKIDLLPPGLLFRGQVIDRHTLNFELDPPWGDLSKGVTNFGGGLYHKATGSRLLYGVLDEWGLPARVRNPWIRSAPYTENHKPIMADLRTTISVTKESTAYMYLSSPYLNLFPKLKLRGFFAAQTETENFIPDFSGGIDAGFGKDINLVAEAFYTGAALPAKNYNSWFSNPPPLPQREFNFYALGLIFNSPLVSVSSDWAYSQTFAWGIDIYGNLGVSLSPYFPKSNLRGKYPGRPLSLSVAVDGAGERFIGRDGANHGAGFRSAGKIEWKGRRSSLLRLNTTLRSPGLGEDFNRSSTGFYYRLPAPDRKTSNVSPLRLRRVSFSMDRNATDSKKITDIYKGSVGFYFYLPKPVFSGNMLTKMESINSNPLGVNLSGSLRSIYKTDKQPSPYPFPNTGSQEDIWLYDSAGLGCELSWSVSPFQFTAKCGYETSVKKDGQWDAAFGIIFRSRQGRLSLKASSPDFPDNWNYTVSWRLEKK